MLVAMLPQVRLQGKRTVHKGKECCTLLLNSDLTDIQSGVLTWGLTACLLACLLWAVMSCLSRLTSVDPVLLALMFDISHF